MLDRFETPLHYLKIFSVVAIVAAGLLLLGYMCADASAYGLVSPRQENTAISDDATVYEWYDKPNVITRSTERMIKDASRVAAVVASGVVNSAQFTASATIKGASYMVSSYLTGMRFVATGMMDVLTFGARSIGSVFGRVTNNRLVGSVIRPNTHAQIPELNPDEALTFTRRETEAEISVPTPAQEQEVSQVVVSSAWPIHGRITTLFGVPHWPYQATHTGLDISSGKSSGKTAVHPFKPGKVVETVMSKSGLGNHIVIDHGGGITSVYAHLASIAVAVGQEVKHDTVIGQEGTTGVSTGTHLHFEIRLNGRPVNPYDYVSGQP